LPSYSRRPDRAVASRRMRAVFVVYMTIIVVGIVFYTVIGLAHY
jgi:hypothetical protein